MYFCFFFFSNLISLMVKNTKLSPQQLVTGKFKVSSVTIICYLLKSHFSVFILTNQTIKYFNRYIINFYKLLSNVTNVIIHILFLCDNEVIIKSWSHSQNTNIFKSIGCVESNKMRCSRWKILLLGSPTQIFSV